ncbi:MAG: DUF4340 domain-containing protein [Clostridia bacterium]|nr:DUF4340 domain-containing protein [Clostridia bacterium]
MQEVRKRHRHSSPRWLRPALLLLALLIAGLSLYAWQRGENAPQPQAEDVHSDGLLLTAETEDISGIRIDFGGSAWSAAVSDGQLILPDGRPVSASTAEGILAAARNVGWTEVLVEDASWQERLEEFGLDTPLLTALFTYTDGRQVTLKVGSRLPGEEGAYYLWIGGDSRLLALDTGTVTDLMVDDSHLLDALQPGIEKNRIDRIEVTDASGTRVWALEGEVTDPDAADRWYLTEPFRYPADSESLESLRDSLQTFHVGACVCDATPENLSLYGFDSPRASVTVHMAAAAVLTPDAEGGLRESLRQEESVTLLIGSAKSDMVDYVCCRGQIGIASRFSHETFSARQARNTLTRYLVLTSLSSLKRLTITEGGETTVYEVSYAAEAEASDAAEGRITADSADADLVADFSEASLLDADETPAGRVTRNGEPISWEAFSQYWEGLLLVTASGVLPEDWQPTEPPRAQWTFETSTGLTRTLTLTPFDPLHDAVALDGTAVFYLIEGGLAGSF